MKAPKTLVLPITPHPIEGGEQRYWKALQFARADDGTRTRNFYHGKVVRYQLRHIRMDAESASLKNYFTSWHGTYARPRESTLPRDVRIIIIIIIDDADMGEQFRQVHIEMVT